MTKLVRLISIGLVVAVIGLFLPAQQVSIEGIGTLSVGSEVTYASPDDTGWLNPGNNEANSNWTNPQRMYVSDNSRASASAQGEDAATVKLYDFGISIPSGSIIDGIEVGIEASYFTIIIPPTERKIRARLMWNGRANETSYKETPNVTTSDQYYTLGGSTDTWGRTWSADDFTNANFAVRVTSNLAGGLFPWLLVDHVRVKVYYTPVTIDITAPADIAGWNLTPLGAQPLTQPGTLQVDVTPDSTSWSVTAKDLDGTTDGFMTEWTGAYGTAQLFTAMQVQGPATTVTLPNSGGTAIATGSGDNSSIITFRQTVLWNDEVNTYRIVVTFIGSTTP